MLMYLAHAYCDLAHAYYDLAHAYSSIYYIPTWISVMRIWHMRIFPSLKKRMSQGPAVSSCFHAVKGKWLEPN